VVDGLDAISTPINNMGEITVQQIYSDGNSKRHTRALYAVRICSSEASLGTLRISWASMINQKDFENARVKSGYTRNLGLRFPS
jgi:hypothetical protein